MLASSLPSGACPSRATPAFCPPANDNAVSPENERRPVFPRDALLVKAVQGRPLPFAGSPARKKQNVRSGQYCHVKPEISVQQMHRRSHSATLTIHRWS